MKQTVYPFHFLVRATDLIRFCLSKLQTNRIVRSSHSAILEGIIINLDYSKTVSTVFKTVA